MAKKDKQSSIGNEGLEKRKGISKSSVTDNTDVTDNRNVTDNTENPTRLSVLCDNEVRHRIFGEETFEKILAILATSKEYFTFDKIAKKLDKSPDNIRQAMTRKKHYFHQIKPDGKKVLSQLSQIAVDEISSRIDNFNQKMAEKQQKEEQEKKEISSKEMLILAAKEFLNLNKKKIGKQLKSSDSSIFIDFSNLSEFSIELAEKVISNPEQTLKLMEQAFEESGLGDNITLRVINLPSDRGVAIENIRAKYLGELIMVEGRVVSLTDVRPQCVNAKFECPSCLPKGTLIHTRYGLQKIEDVDKVLSVNNSFELIEKKARVINTGRKKVYKINNEIECSSEHKWFVYRNGITKVLQTKDLKSGDILYGLNDRKLFNLQQKNTQESFEQKEKDLQLGLQKKIGKPSSERWRESKIRQSENNKIIQGRKINCTNCKYNEHFSQINKEKTDKSWCEVENYERAMQNKCETIKYIQAWKKMWRKGLSQVGERELPHDLYDVWKNQGQNKEIINTSQRWKPLQQQCGQFDYSLQFMPYEVTQVIETTKEVEMIDLQIPDTNNFILENGIVTHNCGTIISVLQIEKKFREPTRCSCGRRGGFKMISKEMVDTARIILEDLQEKTDNPHTRRLNIFIKDDLTSPQNIKLFTPGNEVKVVGILKEVPVPIGLGGLSTRFELALEVNSVQLSEEEIDIKNLTEDEINQIQHIAARVDSEGLGIISSSFAPDVYGHEEIKQAIILQLCNKRNISKNGSIRNKNNILLIGDPGSAKSVLGNFAVDITPGARKVTGGGSSAVGITASVVKDEDGWRVEPGAFVLAKDLLFIDELNNLHDEDKPKLQEAMSEQSVTISKANIRMKMKVTAGALATANPEKGIFKDNEDIVQQFNLPAPIINRFDVIFVIRDFINRQIDEAIAEKMISRERGEIIAEYDKDLLKKFFVYIKQFDDPLIDKQLSDIMKSVYSKIRSFKTSSININPRFKESLIRLSKASAKLRMSKKVEEKDIERSINILSKSYYNTPDYKSLKDYK